MLLARIYEALPLLCPACGGQMRILAFLTDPPTVAAILVHLEMPHTPPPISPARGPPQGDFLLDQTLTSCSISPAPPSATTEAAPLPDSHEGLTLFHPAAPTRAYHSLIASSAIPAALPSDGHSPTPPRTSILPRTPRHVPSVRSYP